MIGTRSKAGSRKPPEVGRTRGGSGIGGAGPAEGRGAPEWAGRHSSRETSLKLSSRIGEQLSGTFSHTHFLRQGCDRADSVPTGTPVVGGSWAGEQPGFLRELEAAYLACPLS